MHGERTILSQHLHLRKNSNNHRTFVQLMSSFAIVKLSNYCMTYLLLGMVVQHIFIVLDLIPVILVHLFVLLLLSQSFFLLHPSSCFHHQGTYLVMSCPSHHHYFSPCFRWWQYNVPNLCCPLQYNCMMLFMNYWHIALYHQTLLLSTTCY